METEILGLRTWRQRKGVTLVAISASTKLSVSQLEAIECGDFRKLPGGIYNTSYIKQYARAIEFDEFELLDFYNNSYLGISKAERPEQQSPGRPSGLLFQH